MRITLHINDDIHRQAKRKSAELGLSLARFIEGAVEERLIRLEQLSPKRVTLPVSPVSGPPLSEEEMRIRIEAALHTDDLIEAISEGWHQAEASDFVDPDPESVFRRADKSQDGHGQALR